MEVRVNVRVKVRVIVRVKVRVMVVTLLKFNKRRGSILITGIPFMST